MALNVISSLTIGTGDILCNSVSATIRLMDDFTGKRPLGPITVTIQKRYLFNWNDLQENDKLRLKDFLKKGFDFNWVQKAIIEKHNDDTIKVHENEKKVLWLRLNKEKTAVEMVTGDKRIGEFITRKENDNLNIYYERKIKPVKNLGGYYIFNDLSPGTYLVDIEAGLYFSEEKKVCIMGFDTLGPAKDAKSAVLTDVSELEDEEEVEFHNPCGDVERRNVSVDFEDRRISWDKELTYDFSEKGSIVTARKYLHVKITLKPRPSYPFPGNATLLRGVISNNDHVPDAVVNVEGMYIRTKTDEKGEFVLYFKKIEDNSLISIEIIKNKKTKPIHAILIKAGNTLSLGKILFS